MTVATDAKAAIEARLAEYLAGEPDDLHIVARTYHALPVYRDMGGSLFLTPNGNVLTVEHDKETMGPVPEQSERWRLVAIVAAAERYPELACLLPGRPTTAQHCQACGGVGRIASGRCASCSGLGWHPLAPEPLVQRG